MILAILLASFHQYRLPILWTVALGTVFLEHTAAGTAPEFHRIPFSSHCGNLNRIKST